LCYLFIEIENFKQKPDFVVHMPDKMTAAIDSAYSMYCGCMGKYEHFCYF